MARLLEELIGPGYHEMSDEELEKLMRDGRTAREVADGPGKGTRQRKAAAESKLTHTAEDLAEYD